VEVRESTQQHGRLVATLTTRPDGTREISIRRAGDLPFTLADVAKAAKVARAYLPEQAHVELVGFGRPTRFHASYSKKG